MATVIIGAAVAVWVVLAFRSIRKAKKNGCGCGCEGCAGHCHDNKIVKE